MSTKDRGVERVVRHGWGACAIRLLRDVVLPPPHIPGVLPAGTEVVAELFGREVRLSSDRLSRSVLLPLQEGVDFAVVDGRSPWRS
jgi:hypothetical protein